MSVRWVRKWLLVFAFVTRWGILFSCPSRQCSKKSFMRGTKRKVMTWFITWEGPKFGKAPYPTKSTKLRSRMFLALSMETVKFGKNFGLLLRFGISVVVAWWNHFRSQLNAFWKKWKRKKSVPVFDGKMNGAFATKNSLLLCFSKHFFPLKPENKETAYVESSS